MLTGFGIKSAVFGDISVLERTKNGDYVNVSDMTLKDAAPVTYRIYGTDAQFLIALKIQRSKIYEPAVAEVTTEELLTLADIKNKNFAHQISTNLDRSSAEHAIAYICAGKIMSYIEGKCEVTDRDKKGFTCQFTRSKLDENKKRYRPVVLEKKFKFVDISVYMTRVTKSVVERKTKDYYAR